MGKSLFCLVRDKGASCIEASIYSVL